MERGRYSQDDALAKLEENDLALLPCEFKESELRIHSAIISLFINKVQHFVVFGSLLISALLITAGALRSPTQVQCVRSLNGWSPMLEAVEYRLHKTTTDAAKKFLYLKQPDLEPMEKAWGALWEFGSLGISETQLPLLNKTSTEKDWHYLPPELGGGIQAYFEGFHYLHCVNLARQYVHRDEGNYSHTHAFHNPNIDILRHVEHCIEMLRVKLMCDADTTPYLVYGDVDQRRHIINMYPKRQCKNFEMITQWADKHITLKFDPGPKA